MAPLDGLQRSFSWLGVCTASSKRGRLYLFGIMVAIEVVGFAAAAVFVMKNISIDLEATLYALLQSTSGGSSFYMILSAFVMQRKIRAIFDHLADLHNSYAREDSYHYLERANSKSEWILQMYVKYYMIGFAINMVATDIFSIVSCCLMYGTIDTAHLYHPCMLILPWNQETLFGHIGEICFAIIICEAYFIINGSFVLLFVSLCLHHKAFSEMFEHTLNKLQSPPEHRRNAKWEQLNELIRLHNSFKQLFLRSANVYSPIVTIQLICCMFYSGVTIFQLNLQMDHINFGMTHLLIVFLTGLSNLFIFCYFGMLATDSFSKAADYLYEYDWQKLPIGLQKNFPLMIQNTQQPIFYYGFGIAFLNLETFTQVMKSVYTFFMMCKKLTLQ